MNLISLRDRLDKVWRSPALRVMFLTFLGMLLGLAVDMLTAAKLGTSLTADALIIALSLPRLIDTVSREGTKFSLIPLFMERRSTLNQDSFDLFVSGILNLSLVVGIVATIIFEIFAPWIVTVLAPGFSAAGIAEATFLFRASAPLVIFAPGIAVLSVLLNSQRRFYGVALRNAVAPGFMVAAFGLAWNQNNIAFWVALAYAVGFAGFFVTLFFDARKAGHRHQWCVWVAKDDLKHLWEAGFLPTFGFLLGQLGRLITRQGLVSFAAVGGVATFYFAVRLVSAAQSIIGVSIATTSLPAMTEHNLAGAHTKLAAAIRKNSIAVLLVTLPAVIFIVVFNEQIIDLLYGRGSFGKEAIEQTSQVFVWLGLSLIFTCLIPVINAGLYAQRAYQSAFAVMVGITFVSVFLAWLFLQWGGLVGIAISTPLSAALNVVVIIYFLQKMGIYLLPQRRNNMR